MKRTASFVLAFWLGLCQALADSAFVAPTANGTAAVGQLPGTTTNDDAAAGKVGEYAATFVTAATATVTITNASPAVVTWTAHPYVINSSGIVATGVVNFTTTGGLPTGLSVGTNYYAVPIDANSFHVATSVANALAGTFVNTSSAGSGTHTGVSEAIMSNNIIIDIGGLALTAGDWDCRGAISIDPAAGTTTSVEAGWLHTASATGPTGSARVAYIASRAALAAGTSSILPFGPGRFSFSSTSNLFFTGQVAFAVSTLSALGWANCRRVR